MWDIVLMFLSMLDCGVDVCDVCFVCGVEYILFKEVWLWFGDWSFKVVFIVVVSGWYFYYENEMYFDVDDIVVVMIVFLECFVCGFFDMEGWVMVVLECVLRWIMVMVSCNGVWGVFDKDNISKLIMVYLFCDFGEVLDVLFVDVMVYVVEMLGWMGCMLKDVLVVKVVVYLCVE